VADEFRVHLLNPAGLNAATRVGGLFEKLLEELSLDVPPGRERSLVITKLQEASYWAKRAIAVQPWNQKEP
jgi:hypothetical protein